jgi:hypothetical protein
MISILSFIVGPWAWAIFRFDFDVAIRHFRQENGTQALCIEILSIVGSRIDDLILAGTRVLLAWKVVLSGLIRLKDFSWDFT